MLTSLSMVGMEICSKIWGLPNVWSSDLPVCSMFLNFRTLGRSWDPLGRSRDALGVLLGTLGELLGRSWAPLGRSWGTLGRSWDALGALLGASWTTLGRNLEKCRGEWRSWGPTWRPKSTQVGSKILEKSISKQTLILKRLFLSFVPVFYRFPLRSKNVDFVKNSVFPRENHDFWSSDFMWQNTFLNSKTFQKIYFFARKPSKMNVQIHENLSKIRYENLS